MKCTMIAPNVLAKQAAPAIRRSFRRFVRNRGDGARGVAAIEFASIASVLVVMMIGTVDLGMGFYRKMQVQNAAQAGSQYAMAHGFDESKISAAVTSATAFSGVAASPPPRKFDGCPSSTGVTNPDADSKCSGGSTAGTYVTVSAQGVYYTILPFLPLGIPDSFTFAAQSTVRLQ